MDIAVIGLAVMGQNLILNMNDKGFKVVAYNRSPEKTKEFSGKYAEGTNIKVAYSIEELISKLDKPRKIMLMVKAGEVVDSYIDKLLPLLDGGDIIIDGGNSNYNDTQRRYNNLNEKGIHFIGMGISGGEEGARFGPSIMPGGSKEAWGSVEHIFKKIAAKTKSGDICCEWIGEGGSGHFVKMVHNGIEYGDMQLIAESYDLLKKTTDYSNDELSEVYRQWNETDLSSYLIEITSEILKFRNEKGEEVIDTILDTAGQKGTGTWTSINSLELSVPLTLISEAVFARIISSNKTERVEAEKLYNKPIPKEPEDKVTFVNDLKNALIFAKVISYAQGYLLMRAASEKYNWNLNYGEIAMIWREGCIIKSVFLQKIKDAYDRNKNIKSLLFDKYFIGLLQDTQESLRNIIIKAVKYGVPIPALSSALSFFDSYTSGQLPANMIQAQRDYFGAHTYERKDGKPGEYYHTDWIKLYNIK